MEEPEVEVSEWIARTVHRDIAKLPFSEFFQASPILVPMPRSGLATPGAGQVATGGQTARTGAASMLLPGLGLVVLAGLARRVRRAV